MAFKLPQVTFKGRERLLATVASLAIMVVVLDQVVLGPWRAHVGTIREEVIEMETALRQHARLLSRKDLVAAQLVPYERYLRPAAPNDELQMAALLQEIEQVAANSRIELGEIKPLTVEGDEFARRYPLEARFRCTLDEWIDFVYQLETSPLLFQVVRADLSVSDEIPDLLQGSLRVVSTAVLKAHALHPATPKDAQDDVSTATD